jgi:protoporphyrinogen oxidase
LNNIVVIGAGPAGTGCAYELAKGGYPSLVIEKAEVAGGLCRTLNFNGYLFDIGGHRFLSYSQEVNALWRQILREDLLRVKRLSRIYYRKKYFNYPLNFLNTFWNLGPLESAACIGSYLKCKYSRPGDDSTFEGWVINRFGDRLFNIFFKSYTQKVWDLECQDISSDWARQRISGLSLRVALQKALLGIKGDSPKTLCEEFLYPQAGPGQFCGRLQKTVSDLGGIFKFNSRVIGIRHDDKRIHSVIIESRLDGKREEIPADYLFSSMPLPTFIKSLLPLPPQEVIKASGKLGFRSFIVVNIILDKEHIFPDQWLYIHSPEVKLSRIQNYKNWSAGMVDDSKKTSLGLEYFCNEADSLWMMNDVDLVDFALGELEKIGIISRRHLINAFVVRAADAYPVYALDYLRNIEIVRSYLRRFPNFQAMGRAGLFRYCNSDYALLTGIYSAKNLLGYEAVDIWADAMSNQASSYHSA